MHSSPQNAYGTGLSLNCFHILSTSHAGCLEALQCFGQIWFFLPSLCAFLFNLKQCDQHGMGCAACDDYISELCFMAYVRIKVNLFQAHIKKQVNLKECNFWLKDAKLIKLQVNIYPNPMLGIWMGLFCCFLILRLLLRKFRKIPYLFVILQELVLKLRNFANDAFWYFDHKFNFS